LKNLLKRTISGVIYLIIVIGSLFIGEYGYGIVFALIGLLALIEFFDLTEIPRFGRITIAGLIVGVLLFIIAFLVTSRTIGYHYLMTAGIMPILLYILTLYTQDTHFTSGLSKVCLGILYVIIPLAIMNYLVFPAVNNYAYTHRIVLGVLTLVWINDTGAYVTGSTFGKHKLFPAISPKKSWEGLIGGTLLTLLPSFWMNSIMGVLAVTDWIVLAAIVSVFGVYGDLTESIIKRNANRKDSGTLIPGHGGILDRIDSILFVMPVTVLYLLLRGL
jgi:phosphatidate cytidylyltransferase